MSNSDLPMTPEAIAAREAGESISRQRALAFDKVGLTLERIAQELATIALSRIDDYVSVGEGGKIEGIAFDKIDPAKIPAIKKIKQHTGEIKGDIINSRVEFELHDKMEALRYACKVRGDEVNKLDITDNRMVQMILDALPADLAESVTEAIKVKAKGERGK